MPLIRGRNFQTVAIAQGGSAATTDLIAAPSAATSRIVVVGLMVGLGATLGTIKFQSGTGPTDITGAINVPVNGSFVAMANLENSAVFFAGLGEKLTIVSTGSGANGWLNYYILPGTQ